MVFHKEIGPNQRDGFGRALLPVVALPVLAMAASITTPLWPSWQARFDFGPGTTTVLFALYVYALIPGAMLAPAARARFGTRPLVLGALLLALAGNLLLWFANSVIALGTARLIQGAGIGFASGPLTASLLAVVAPAAAAPVARLVAVVLTAGAGAGPVLSGFLAGSDGADPSAVFLVMTILLGIAAVAARQLHAPAVRAEPVTEGSSGPLVPPGAPISMLSWAIAYTVLATSPGFARELLESDRPLVIGAPAGLLLFASAAMQLIAPRLFERPTMWPGTALMLPGLVAFAAVVWEPSLWLLCTALIVIGLGHGLAFPAALQTATASGADSATTSRFFAITYAGGVVPMLAVGVLATLTGIVDAMTVFAIGAGIACLVATGATRPRRHQTAVPSPTR